MPVRRRRGERESGRYSRTDGTEPVPRRRRLWLGPPETSAGAPARVVVSRWRGRVGPGSGPTGERPDGPAERRRWCGVRCAPDDPWKSAGPGSSPPPSPGGASGMARLVGRTHDRSRSPRWEASGRWNNVGKGSRQDGSVTSGQGLALSVAGPPRACRSVGLGRPAGKVGGRGRDERRTQNRQWLGESDCLIKTKHFDGSAARWGVDGMWFLPSALNVKVKKFEEARVNGGSNYDSLKVAKCLVI